ncbi:MAG: cobalamin B12-binding domain-containing protein [Blastocatellia bacterium]|nr:cobalamin B12-binding domain-containing protein [Blastocatellia bacterium]
MAQENQQSRRVHSHNEPDPVARALPFLVGLWRQIDPAPKPSTPEEPELFAALETEIIPRLLIANSVRDAYPRLVRSEPAEGQLNFSARDRSEFVDALLSDDASHTRDLAEAHLSAGHEPSAILLDLFAWSARELGALWEDDRVSFVDVTIGLCRLHEALHRCAEQADATGLPVLADAPSILIATAPGEQHVFGVLMAAELFRHQGWEVTAETSGDGAVLARLVSSRRFDIAGLSASQDGSLDGLAALVKTLRKVSKNPAMKMLAGGQLFEQSPHLAHEIGADGIAGRGADAPELARKMLVIS